VTAWLEAHAAHDAAAEVAQLTDDVVVVDDGRTYRGRKAVTDWSTRTSATFEFTSTVLSTEVDDDVCVVMRVEGSFPGSPVELTYRFELTHDHISALTIALRQPDVRTGTAPATP
jgi:ketosteroid isomerase-like protein